MLAAWLHDINPVIFHIAGAWAVRWYGVAYLTGFLSGWMILRWCSRRGLTPLSETQIGDLVLYAVAGVVLGGRLGYVAFYQRSLLWTFEPGVPWWGVLMIQKGGMSSHGGMIGVILAGVIWFVRLPRGARPSLLHVLDLLAFATTPGLFFGRLANFINGELLGKIVAMPGEPAPWWSVKYPQELLTGHDPVRAGLLTGEAARRRTEALDAVLNDVRLPGDGSEQAIQRLIDRVQHGSKDLAARLEPLISARHPSQLYQAAAEGLLLGLILFFIWRRPRMPGVIGGWLLIVYGVMRILTELIRLPDTGLGWERFMGLSRGQWLSAAMIVSGAVGLAIVLRRHSPLRFGGWGEHRTTAVGAGANP